jgi:hypothetical protein
MPMKISFTVPPSPVNAMETFLSRITYMPGPPICTASRTKTGDHWQIHAPCSRNESFFLFLYYIHPATLLLYNNLPRQAAGSEHPQIPGRA